MGLAYATRSPTYIEDNTLRLLLSTYRDGTGNQREKDQSTRASWREIERCVGELLGGAGGEDKHIFDLIALDDTNSNVGYGFSVKSKQLSRTDFSRLHADSRVYMEIANSPAKFWGAIKGQLGYDESDFSNQRHAEEIGRIVIDTVVKWHAEGKQSYESKHPGVELDLEHSRYLCVSYSDDVPDKRKYQVHAFALDYIPNVIWKYTSAKCLSGYDPKHPGQKLIDWYGLSGGQLKYYPLGSSAVYHSTVFALLKPDRQLSILDKAKTYFPNEFI
jgi:hypothetical protein